MSRSSAQQLPVERITRSRTLAFEPGFVQGNTPNTVHQFDKFFKISVLSQRSEAITRWKNARRVVPLKIIDPDILDRFLVVITSFSQERLAFHIPIIDHRDNWFLFKKIIFSPLENLIFQSTIVIADLNIGEIGPPNHASDQFTGVRPPQVDSFSEVLKRFQVTRGVDPVLKHRRTPVERPADL